MPGGNGWRTAVALAFALCVLALLLWLGFWQLHRATLKEDLLSSQAIQRSLAELPLEQAMAGPSGGESAAYRRTVARGRFDRERQYLLDNRTYRGVAGYSVLTPLVGPSGAIIVERGWLPVGERRDRLPPLAVPDDVVTVRGTLAPPPSPGLILGATGYDSMQWPKVVQVVDLDTMSVQLGEALAPLLLLLDADDPACQTCERQPVPGVSARKHRGYAFQWFALAAALVVIVGLMLYRSRQRAG